MKHRSTILDIIEAGLYGQPEHVQGYTELLIQHIQADQSIPLEERESDVKALRQLLVRKASGDRGCVIINAEQ